MSLTNHGKHAKAAPRGGSPKLRRGGLVAAALAVLVAAIVAVPALVAMAAPDYPLSVTIEAKDSGEFPKTDIIDGEDVWGDTATYTVTVTTEGSSIELDTTRTTVTGTVDGTVGWATDSTWTKSEYGEGGTTYTRDFTVSESSHNKVTVATFYSETDGSADEILVGPTDTKTVTVDMSGPEVSIVFNDVMVGRDDSENVVYFDDKNLTATVTVTDPTFDKENSSIQAADGTKVDADWQSVADTGQWTFEVPCTDIGTSFSVTAVDGNSRTTSADSNNAVDQNNNSLDNARFEIDTRDIPTIEFSASETPEEGNYFDGDVTLTVTVTGDDPEVEGLEDWTSDTENSTNDKKVYTKIFSDERTQTIPVSAKNKGIFQAQQKNQYTFTVDKTDPTVDVKYNLTPESGSVYDVKNGDLQATIVVTEETSWDKSLIEVTLKGEKQTVTWTDNPAAGTHTATVTFPKDAVTELGVTGADAAGRELDASKSTVKLPSTVTTDSIAPDIAITYVNDEGTTVTPNGKGYFNTHVTPTVTVTEANFDKNATTVTVDGKEQSDLTWTKNDDGTWSCTLEKLTDEGDHSIKVATTDAAGHNASRTNEFKIDTSPIEFKVTWDGSKAEEPLEGEDDGTAYYPSALTATIKPSETNFTDGEIVFTTGSPTVTPVWNDADGMWTVSYPTDGAYRLEIEGTDDADNAVEDYDSLPFVVDTTAPELDVKFADGDAAKATDEDGVAYYNAVRTATITVDELNFSADRVTIDTAGTYGESAWTTEGTVHTLTVTFPDSVSNHYLNVSVTDRAGNECVGADGNAFKYESGTFVVDTTAPEVSIELDKPLIQTFEGADFFSEAPTATVTVKDAHFNPETSTIEATGATFGEWVEGDTVDGFTTWTSTATFTEGTGRMLTVNASDWATNPTTKAYQNNAVTGETTLTSATFTVDLSAPVVTSASMSNPPSNDYNGDHFFFDSETTMSVVVEDNIGLESFQVVKGEDTSNYYVANYPETSVNVEGGVQYTVVIGLADGETFDNTIRVCTKDHAGNLRYWDLTPNGQEVYVTHVDDVTNPPVFDGIYPDSLLQDTIFPKLSLTGPAAGSYSNTPQTVSLSVEELNVPILQTYEPGQVVLTVTQVAGDASAATTSWTRPVSQLAHVDGITYALSELLSADGHYTVSAQVTDPAGNPATDELAEFTIDQTAPVVEVTFDNNDVRNGKYYKAARTATITVTEHNFDPSLVTIETNGAVGSWSTSGDVHTITVSFTTDGVYNLSVSGADMAGNAMAAYQADEFVVDLQAPEITFDGVEDQTAYNDSVQPVIIFTDEANFDANGVSYTITGTKNGEVAYETFVSDQEQGQTVTYADFVREAEVDDIYTINANLTDLAGNEAEGTITFSVNRFGSTFRVLDAGSYTENNGYLLEGRDVVVEEINVSGVESEKHAVTVTEGTSVSQLTLNETPQTTGYTIEAATSDDPDSNGWSVYTYSIPAGNFVRDGRYHVSVESEDLAANTNTSSNYYDREAGQTAAAEVDFILDTTDPVVTSLNIEDGAVYETGTYEGTFTVVENIGVQGVEVLVDGKAVEVTDDGYGNYSFKVESASFTPRSLSITATDLAGRTGSAGAEDFRVTTDIFELHLPLVIAGIVAAVVVAGGLVYFLVIKPKRDDEDAKKAA